ncbi:MAG TPA: protein phosphatase 2C domain-containing protein [Rariglobus sp.]|jgi:protein phosphatase|nr:protein phosphatase 2C domain-containing protein [Rariglobus sp.]
MKLRSAALTDIGKVRSENEDRFLCEDTLGLYGIADGIGGLPGGAEAASCAVGFIKAGVIAGVVDLTALTQAASEAVVELGQQINPSFGIGSTLTFGLFKDGRLRLSHVGDSRAYLLRGGLIQALTEDHNIENEARQLRARGEIIEVTKANGQALTRCIGQPGLPQVDLKDMPVFTGDRFLFVTDGVTRMITNEELSELLATEAEPGDIMQGIIDLSLSRGGYDNVTGVLVFVDEA